MKLTKLITVGAVALSLTIGTLAASESKTKDDQKATSTEYCLSISDLAKVIMQRRQGGIPMTILIKLAEEDEVAHAIIMEAYSQPIYSTIETKQKAIQTFADSVLMTCLQVANEQLQSSK